MSRIRTFAACLLLCLSSVLSNAAVGGGPSGKTLAQAIERAGGAPLGVRIATAEVDAARARVKQARAPFYPSVDLLTNVDRINNFDSFSGITASVNIPQVNVSSTVAVTQTVPRYQAGGTLQIKYDAYTGGRDSAQLRRQELALEAAEVSRRISQQDVTLDIAETYFKLRRACMEHDGAARRFVRAQRLADVTKQRTLEGRIAAIEQSASVLALAEGRSAVRSREQELDIAYTDYLAASRDSTAAEPPEQRCRFALAVDVDLAYAVQLSDDTLDAQLQSLRVRGAKESVEVDRSGLKPQVSLFARYSGVGRSDSSIGDGFSNFSRRQASIGLQVSFNLFDGDLTRQRVVESLAEVERRGLVAEQSAVDRELAHRRSEIGVRMAANRIELANARLDLARIQATLARDRLQSGTGTAEASDDQVERERDARAEAQLAELDMAMARLSALFPSGRATTRTARTP